MEEHLYVHFPDLDLFTVVGGVSMIGGILALSVVIGCMTTRIRITRLETKRL